MIKWRGAAGEDVCFGRWLGRGGEGREKKALHKQLAPLTYIMWTVLIAAGWKKSTHA